MQGQQEEAVGILNYANAAPGFRGILKQRQVLKGTHGAAVAV